MTTQQDQCTIIGGICSCEPKPHRSEDLSALPTNWLQQSLKFHSVGKPLDLYFSDMKASTLGNHLGSQSQSFPLYHDAKLFSELIPQSADIVWSNYKLWEIWQIALAVSHWASICQPVLGNKLKTLLPNTNNVQCHFPNTTLLYNTTTPKGCKRDHTTAIT